MGNIIEIHRDLEHKFGSDQDKMAYVKDLVHLFRGVELPVLRGGVVEYELQFSTIPEKKALGPRISVMKREMTRAPDGAVWPFYNFMQTVANAAGLLGVLRSNEEEAEQMRKTIMDYFRHCADNYWAPNLRRRNDQNQEGLSRAETGAKYQIRNKGKAQLEYFTDKFFNVLVPRIESKVGEYDNSALHEKMDLVVAEFT